MQRTAEKFAAFFTKLHPGFPAAHTEPLVCTTYTNGRDAYLALNVLIDIEDISAKTQFFKNKAFSGLVSVTYKDSGITDGFAKVEIQFLEKKGKPRYTIVFKNPNQ